MGNMCSKLVFEKNVVFLVFSDNLFIPKRFVSYYIFIHNYYEKINVKYNKLNLIFYIEEANCIL